MRIQEAYNILNELEDKGRWYIKQWGLSTAKEAIYTVYHRKNVEPHYLRIAQDLYLKVYYNC